MSPRLRPEPFAADHERARLLAAQRLDGALPSDDAGWLNDHLAWCGPCRAVADEYGEQRLSLRALRHDQPQPPRDLWARTAAAIETQPARRGRTRRRRFGALGYAPLVGALVVAIIVGSSVFDRVFPPLGSTTKGDDAEATPFALAAGEIQVLSHNDDGSLELFSKRLDEMCPVAADSCGLSNVLDSTQVGSLGSKGQLDAIVSPDRGHLVVVERGSGSSGVYVLPLKTREPATTDAPSAPDTTAPPTHATAIASGPTPTTTAGPSAAASADTGASASPAESPSTSETPASSASPDASPSDSATPSDEPVASPSATADASAEPTASPADSPTPTDTTPSEAPTEPATSPTPSVEVTPGPDGAIEIAHDVVIVGSVAAYSPDGSRFAFSARPADGSQGPDVYVWRVGDRLAHAVTTDHDSQLAGWIGARLLVSRVVDGTPRTTVLDLSDKSQRSVRDGAMWRPTVGPGRKTAAWWDGTVRRAGDGITWVPAKGRLVLGAWPDGGDDDQVLADGPISDWDVQWDDTGSQLAVWVAGDGQDGVGKLSLYSIDPTTGRPDLANPHLDGTPALAGFALEPGRLAWSAPDQGGDTSVEVLAWSGDTFGRTSLPTENGSTIVH